MGFPVRSRSRWHLRTRTMALGERTHIMGIVNVTPDSFSDGGEHATTEQAIAHALQLLDEGADILDIGGESTRPGSNAATGEAISVEQEQERVLPVIAGVLRVTPDAVLSVDTYRAATARAAVLAGAEIVNDVSGGLWDSAMFTACAELQCGVIVMHTRGLPSEWARQQPLAQHDVVPFVLRELQARVQQAELAGLARSRIVADPGFGFGKRGAENWTLLAGLSAFAAEGLPLMAGLSRKGFLASALQSKGVPASRGIQAQFAPHDRDDLTHAANMAAILQGAHLLRVHDVRGAVRSAAMADLLLAEAK